PDARSYPAGGRTASASGPPPASQRGGGPAAHGSAARRPHSVAPGRGRPEERARRTRPRPGTRAPDPPPPRGRGGACPPPPAPGGDGGRRPRRHLEGEAGLAAAARAGERDQAVSPELLPDLCHLGLAADEAREREGEVGRKPGGLRRRLWGQLPERGSTSPV